MLIAGNWNIQEKLGNHETKMRNKCSMSTLGLISPSVSCMYNQILDTWKCTAGKKGDRFYPYANNDKRKKQIYVTINNNLYIYLFIFINPRASAD